MQKVRLLLSFTAFFFSYLFFISKMGELARHPDSPQLANTPLELLTPRSGEGFTTFQKMVWPVLAGSAGLGCSLLISKTFMRPLWSGLPRHILIIGAAAYIGSIVRDVKFASFSEVDAVYKHYISLHPEDFPPFERKRFADVYLPFRPAR